MIYHHIPCNHLHFHWLMVTVMSCKVAVGDVFSIFYLEQFVRAILCANEWEKSMVN